MIQHFFLKNIIFIKQMIATFFSYFPELKPNLTQSETADNGVLKGFKWQSVVCVVYI